jgi:hypothetical protein
MELDPDQQAAKIELITRSLHTRLDRLPTEDEVYDFITGDHETRMRIWNAEVTTE